MEQVFCLKRTDIEPLFGKPLRQGAFATPSLASVFTLPHYFIPRREAENDPGFKQLIPYQLFTCEERFFVYQRGKKVGEQRLAGRFSIGIGGHINSKDADGPALTHSQYEKALCRERYEELVCPNTVETSFLGWINDDSDEVGQVHLGAVHLCRVPIPEDIGIRSDEEGLYNAGWMSRQEVLERKDQFEKWSILALALL